MKEEATLKKVRDSYVFKPYVLFDYFVLNRAPQKFGLKLITWNFLYYHRVSSQNEGVS